MSMQSAARGQGGGQGNKLNCVAPLLAIILLAGYALTVVKPSLVDALALVPGSVVPQLWSLFTASFVESDVPELLLSVVGVLFTARVLEPAWGSTELLKYVGIVAVMSTSAVFCLCLLIYLSSPTAQAALLYMDLNGFHGVLGALLVGIKQVLPDKEAKLFSVVRVPTKYLPGLYLLIASAVGLLLGRLLEVSLFIVTAEYVGWFYLRFLQPKPDGSKGEGSEEFKFSTMFPSFLHQPIDMFAGACSRVLRIHPPVPRTASGISLASGSGGAPAGAPLGMGTGLDASRRRERGARVLEERLGMKPRPAGLAGVIVQQPPTQQPGKPQEQPAAAPAENSQAVANGHQS